MFAQGFEKVAVSVGKALATLVERTARSAPKSAGNKIRSTAEQARKIIGNKKLSEHWISASNRRDPFGKKTDKLLQNKLYGVAGEVSAHAKKVTKSLEKNPLFNRIKRLY